MPTKVIIIYISKNLTSLKRNYYTNNNYYPVKKRAYSDTRIFFPTPAA